MLDKSWKWTKIIFAVGILCVSAYWYGTFKPNKWSTATVTAQLEQFYLEKIKNLDLREPEFTYDKRVPYEMIIGQAALESGWGKSRFATKGNNLFGIRTFTETTPHLLLVGVEKWPGWGVRKFSSKCDSVKEYFRLLNEHRAYKSFRDKRQVMLENNKQLDSIVLIKTLDKFSTTKDYDQRVILIIKKIRKLETK